MIKKLRRKFILIAMLSVFVVLGSIIAFINIANYCNIISNADKILAVLVRNEGKFPQTDDFDPSFQEGALYDKFDKMHGLSPETPYETRFFTVKVLSDGTMSADTGKIAAVSQEEAKEYAAYLVAKNKTNGMYGDYRYAATQIDGCTLYIFLDCTRDMNNFRSFLLYSSLVSLGGLILVLILVIILSRFALKPVEESYRKQKGFITNASHDIKTPLTIIGADTEVIEYTHGESEWSKDIKKQVERLTALTEKLVFLSRMEESDNKLDFKEFNLSELLEETCLSYEATAKLRGLEFTLDVESDIKFNGNEETFRQAVALLCDNAIKYVKSYVKISLKHNGPAKEIRFSNDADDLKQGNLNELFDRFYRADKSRNSKTGGHGIGLSVVKSVITANKGKISAVSPDGKSVDFIITL